MNYHHHLAQISLFHAHLRILSTLHPLSAMNKHSLLLLPLDSLRMLGDSTGYLGRTDFWCRKYLITDHSLHLREKHAKNKLVMAFLEDSTQHGSVIDQTLNWSRCFHQFHKNRAVICVILEYMKISASRRRQGKQDKIDVAIEYSE